MRIVMDKRKTNSIFKIMKEVIRKKRAKKEKTVKEILEKAMEVKH